MHQPVVLLNHIVFSWERLQHVSDIKFLFAAQPTMIHAFLESRHWRDARISKQNKIPINRVEQQNH